MDYLGMLEGKTLIQISEDFNYMKATENFIGLKLFPMVKTDNMKLAVYNLVEGNDVPVMAFVHSLDTEARIGNRPDFEEINYELFLVKEKLNQGEALKKKMRDLGMSNEERAILNAIYDDIAHLISKVITRFEVMACEAIATGKITIRENNVTKEVDYHLPDDHRQVVTAWSNPNTDILGDLVKIQKVAKNKIVRALTSTKVMGYILGNAKFNAIASGNNEYLTEDYAVNYIKARLGIEFIVVDGTYKVDEKDDNEYNFFDEDTISFLTTDGTLGNLFVTTTPEQDYAINNAVSNGYVAITQWYTADPAGVWTKASAVGFPAFKNIKQLYVCKVGA